MPDDLPNKLQVFTRAELLAKYLRSYSVRHPAGNTSKGTQPYIDGSVCADMMVPIYGNAVQIADNASLFNKSLASLQDYCDSIGLRPNLLPASGSAGFVTINASPTGITILAGQEGKDPALNVYVCAATGFYGDGSQVPIVAKTTGPETNVPAGTVITWTSPPAGLGPTCTVLATSQGEGLTGGSDDETRDELIARIQDHQANPPASGNDAAFQAFVENFPGLAIQKCFTFPCINGSGSTGICWTMKPAKPGGSRIPNAVQIAQVRAGMLGAFPNDDSDFFPTLIGYSLNVSLKVSWTKAAAGWADASPWPVFTAGDPVVRDSSGGGTSPTSFRLKTGTPQVDPQVGQVIAFYDNTPTVPVFRRKQIASVAIVSSGLKWDLTFEPSNGASDLTFLPVNGGVASPWSDSLNLLVTPMLLFFDNVGPGEQVAAPYDQGLRQRRQPEDPEEWSSQITGRVQGPLYALSAVKDASVLDPALPFLTPVGTPGVSSYLTQLASLAVFAS